MLPSLRQLFQANYLYAQNTQPLGRWSIGLIALGVALVVGVVIAWVWRNHCRASGKPLLAPTLCLAACLGSQILLLGRVYAVGPFSARVWDVAAVALVLFTPLAHWLMRWPWPAHVRPMGKSLACSLQADDSPMPWGWTIAWGLLHVGSLYTLAVYDGLGWRPAVIALVCLVAASAASRTAGRSAPNLRLEALAPLVLPYSASFLRWLANDPFGANIELYRAFPFADPWSPWFDLQTMLLVGLAWTALTTCALCWRRIRPRANVYAWLGLGLLIASTIWFLVAANVHLSHGVTGSDPFCYLQMAADLAEQGTALHEFPLATLAHRAGLPTWPTVPVGYHPPDEHGVAATVWPIGWPALLAPFYRLGGENAALWIAPCCAILAALVTCTLVRESGIGSDREARLIGGLAAAITLTSREAILRTFVPMADASAQLGAMLMLLALACAYRRNALLWSALAGGALTLAYWVRHPLLFLGLAALLLLLQRDWPWSRRASHVAVFATVALVAALPDLLYHRAVFGSLWATESPERALLSWRHIGLTFQAMLQNGWLRRSEFGYLWPFIAYGWWRQWRNPKARPWAWALTVSFAGTLFFHLSYSALRWRDLIALFAWLGLWAAQGIIAWWLRANQHPHRTDQLARRALVILAVLVSLAARVEATLVLPWQAGAWTFGHVSQLERAAFRELAATLPANAIIGAGLNSGAIMRYTSHPTFRPTPWSDRELGHFISILASEGYTVYLLDDGDDMALTLPRVRTICSLQPVGQFRLPIFGLGGDKQQRPAQLYRLELPQK